MILRFYDFLCAFICSTVCPVFFLFSGGACNNNFEHYGHYAVPGEMLAVGGRSTMFWRL